jgi:hypothetical protein
MNRFCFLFLTILLSLSNCSVDDGYKNVGDIPYDPSTDDINFEICNESNINQYYVRYSSDSPPSYEGEKKGLENVVFQKYNYPISNTQSGYVTIRFIVNCKGQSGRFRVEQMDFNYNSYKFNQNIINQLVEIVKKLDGWIPRKRENINLDFYQYLTFKIENGQIIKILP